MRVGRGHEQRERPGAIGLLSEGFPAQDFSQGSEMLLKLGRRSPARAGGSEQDIGIAKAERGCVPRGHRAQQGIVTHDHGIRIEDGARQLAKSRPALDTGEPARRGEMKRAGRQGLDRRAPEPRLPRSLGKQAQAIRR